MEISRLKEYIPKPSSDLTTVCLLLRLLLGGFFPVRTRLADPKSSFVITVESRPRDIDGVKIRRAEPPRPSATGRLRDELGVAHFMNETFVGVHPIASSFSSCTAAVGGDDGAGDAGESDITFLGNRDRHVSK